MVLHALLVGMRWCGRVHARAVGGSPSTFGYGEAEVLAPLIGQDLEPAGEVERRVAARRAQQRQHLLQHARRQAVIDLGVFARPLRRALSAVVAGTAHGGFNGGIALLRLHRHDVRGAQASVALLGAFGEVVIRERDDVLAESVLRACRAHPGSTVVGVVGMLHVQGIVERVAAASDPLELGS